MDLEKLDSQFIVWQEFLEQIVGVTAFGLALGSLSLPTPFLSLIASLLSFVILNSIIERNKDKFPKLYEHTRNKTQKSKKDVALIAYAKYELLHYKKYPIYMVGTLSLGAVLIGSLVCMPFYVGVI